MTDLDPDLLRAVRAGPADLGLREACADWCRENGCPNRGEFIACQCAIARIQADVRAYRGAGQDLQASARRIRELNARAGELFRLGDVRGDHGLPAAASAGLHQVDAAWMTHTIRVRGPEVPGPEVDRWVFRWVRGFVEKVACSFADLAAYGRGLVAVNPVREFLATTVPLTEAAPVVAEWADQWLPGVVIRFNQALFDRNVVRKRKTLPPDGE